jgi:hypothetical protein
MLCHYGILSPFNIYVVVYKCGINVTLLLENILEWNNSTNLHVLE